MLNPNQNRSAMALYRLDKARQCLITANNTLMDGDYAGSANRSYYAIFHAIRAILALNGLDFKKHSGVIAKFRELYVKTGVFETKYSRIAGAAFDLRNNSDYEDFYVVKKQDVQQQLQDAKEFIEAAEKYVRQNAYVDKSDLG